MRDDAHGSRLNRPLVSPFAAILRQWFREFPVMSSLAVPCFARIWRNFLSVSGVSLVMSGPEAQTQNAQTRGGEPIEHERQKRETKDQRHNQERF
jgi:hypothetical protein